MSEVKGVLIRVGNIRRNDFHGYGGCIFSGNEIDNEGRILDAKSYVVIKASPKALNNLQVKRGQWWLIDGNEVSHRLSVNGYQILERQILPESMRIVLPSGENIVRNLADNSDYRGIGTRKARNLWEHFGRDLYNILNSGDLASLTDILQKDIAENLISMWQRNGESSALEWLDSSGFDERIGRKVLKAFGTEAHKKIQEDPFRLLSFSGKWSKVDQLAQEQFSVKEDDQRRLMAAVEESLYRLFDDGHTCSPRSLVISRLRFLLRDKNGDPQDELIKKALDIGKSNGGYVVLAETLHPVGAYLMERQVAVSLAKRIRNSRTLCSESFVDSLIYSYEDSEGIALNPAQRKSIHLANQNSFSVITGGAGVGKTTLLKGLYKIYSTSGLQIFQLALSGKAAKRMQEASGLPSQTIAGFLKNVTSSELELPNVIVIDEGSMVDVASLYRICRKLPDHSRILMVGDQHQLPPVAAGLTLHELVKIPKVPHMELTEIKRYGGEIAEFAQSIRRGEWPNGLPDSASEPVAFIRCQARDLNQKVLELYLENPSETQILSATKDGLGGVNHINQICQERAAKDAPRMKAWNHTYGSSEDLGFAIGDPVICTRNRWSEELQNGSLGMITSVEESESEGERLFGTILWDDGTEKPVSESLLDDLMLAYSITVHKAQGSQAKRIIIPIRKSRLLDRTLLYTAVTRAQAQVILVGDEDVSREAVESQPKANSRQVSLGSMLTKELDGEVA